MKEPSIALKVKIVMACIRNILKDESQIICNRPLRCSSLTLNPDYLPTLVVTFFAAHEFQLIDPKLNFLTFKHLVGYSLPSKRFSAFGQYIIF